MLVAYLFAALFYFAWAVLLYGLVRKFWRYHRLPVPLNIVLTPAPYRRWGVLARLSREVLLFASLFRANLWTWLCSWLLHWALLLVALRHMRYFLSPVPHWLLYVQTAGTIAALVLVPALLGLLARRLWLERLRYISTPSDFLWLLLFLALAGSGLSMRFLAHTDIVAVKHFFLGCLGEGIQPLPSDPLLLLHLLLAALFMMLLPFSKLLHGMGIWFAPTRNRRDAASGTSNTAPAGT